MAGKEWSIEVLDWRESVAHAKAGDFIYLDPPYLGRNADYFNQWSSDDAAELARVVQSSDAGFALSMWLENSYRKNEHIDVAWPQTERRTVSHFYHVGATEALRNPMTEVLAIRSGFAAASY
jgi:DNA adenine methylase